MESKWNCITDIIIYISLQDPNPKIINVPWFGLGIYLGTEINIDLNFGPNPSLSFGFGLDLGMNHFLLINNQDKPETPKKILWKLSIIAHLVLTKKKPIILNFIFLATNKQIYFSQFILIVAWEISNFDEKYACNAAEKEPSSNLTKKRHHGIQNNRILHIFQNQKRKLPFEIYAFPPQRQKSHGVRHISRSPWSKLEEVRILKWQ